MKHIAGFAWSACMGVSGATLLLAGVGCSKPAAKSPTVNPVVMTRMGTVNPRFQSYNVEMLEVTGGRFWKPYRELGANAKAPTAAQSGATPEGMNPNLYANRPAIDLSNARLRKLAGALGPAYVRVSGTWANTTYFYDGNGRAPAQPPKGFSGVLTRKEWKGVVDFAKAVDAGIVTSVAISPGTRGAKGVWTPQQARQLFDYTKSIGGHIAATEFMNEPTAAAMGGAPKGYDAADYGRDVHDFAHFLKQDGPGTLFLGPGSVGEGGARVIPAGAGFLHSEDLLKAAGPIFQVFSYHLYAAASERCASLGQASQTSPDDALSSDWLTSSPDKINAYYTGLRDQFDPGKPLWITETADAACGGNPWASTYLDTFRYLVWHANLAQRGVQVMMHNTLASSDYGLFDENTYAPRPDYWAALLWHQLMGTTVLRPNVSPAPPLYVYAQCLRNVPGGVALLAINADRSAAHPLDVTANSERYTLTAPQLEATSVDLNGRQLQLGPGDSLPVLAGTVTRPGEVTLPPASITFLAIPSAHNASCR